MKRFLKILANIVFVLVVALVLLLGATILALQFPSVQTSLLEQVTKPLSNKTGFETSAAKLNVKWPDAISIEGVLIKDRSYRPMIEVGRLDINHDFWSIIKGVWTGKLDLSKGLYIDQAMLYQPNVWLVFDKKTGQLNINQWIDALAALSPPDTTQKPSIGVPFGIKKVVVIDGIYRMDDPQRPTINNPRVFDHNHFALTKINGTVRNLYLLGDTLMADVRRLSTIDKNTGLTVKRLDVRYFMCDHKMELGDLDAHVGNSELHKYLAFHYKSFDDFTDFNNKVRMTAQLDSTTVHASDLGYFANYLFTLNETWRGHGDFDGTVQDFTYKGHLAFGKKSRINGKIAFKNVIDYMNADMSFDLKNSHIATSDIHQYYPEKSFNTLTAKFGEVSIAQGKFDGRFKNFKIDGDFKTALGSAKGYLKMDLRPKNPTYDGDLQTTDFDLGTLLDQPDLGKVSLDGKIKGSGFTLQTASLNTETRVAHFTYNNYVYHNVFLKGNLQKQFFDGGVVVRDSNLIANLDGQFDFSGKKYVYQTRGKIERADLRALKFMKDSLRIHSDIEIDMEGNTLDEMVGTGRFLNSYLILNKRSLVIDTLAIDSRLLADTSRRLVINSEFLNFNANGRFKPTQAVADVVKLFDEYKMAFVGDNALRTDYYSKKNLNKPIDNYNIDYKVDFKKTRRLLDFLYPEGYLSNGSKAEGRLTVSNVTELLFESAFDTLKIADNAFYKGKLEINSSKFNNNPEVLASANFTSREQQFSGLATTEKLNLEVSWERDHINFLSSIRQKSQPNRATLNGDLYFVNDDIEIQFKKSKLQLLSNEWNVAANNRLTISGSNVNFSNLMLSNNDQRIALNGAISTDSLRALQFEATKFDLATLNPLLTTKLTGTLNGSGSVRDLYQNPIYESKFDIKKFEINGQPIGDVVANAEWDGIEKHLHLDGQLENNTQKVLSIKGIYDPKSKGNELDLTAAFNNSDLKVIEAFTTGLVSEISGTADGRVRVFGPLTNPKFDGSVAVKKGRLTFDYLKAIFAFEDKIYFDEHEIRVKNLRLTDPEGNVATIKTGGVVIDDYERFWLNFNANLKNFRVLNTTIRDNSMYYGTAYATGNFEMYGPLTNLIIKPTLTTNKGTKIYIPLDGVAEVSSQEFVQFLTPKTTEKDSAVIAGELLKKKIEDVAAANFKVEMQLNMTPDAYCEIQFDRQTKDAMNAYGQGSIMFGYDTRVGNFTMNGDYLVRSGVYNFNFRNAINKKFQIQPGGRITWNGNPYEATIDIKTNYTAMTSLLPIVTNKSISPSLLSRRYPVEITLALADKLSAPAFNFDMKFKEYPSQLGLDVSAVEASLKRNEQYLYTQVTSLLVLNQLFPESADFLVQSGSASSNIVSNSASELVGNQLSNLLSSFNDKFELSVSGLDLSRVNNQLGGVGFWNDVQLRFSYKLLNDRLRITRDGPIFYNQNQYDPANLLLDWTVEYWLSTDGNERLKMYSRNLQNQFTLSSAGVSYGFSYMYSHSFNNFKELNTEPKSKLLRLRKTDTPPPNLTTQVQTKN